MVAGFATGASIIEIETLLHELTPDHNPRFKLVPDTNCALLAKSYQAGKGSDLDTLWKLHLRHGHRNFADLARQYKRCLNKYHHVLRHGQSTLTTQAE